jgi:multiple sugar transport system permease protein
MINTAFKEPIDIYTLPPKWIILNPTLRNFQIIFLEYGSWRFIKNSLIIASLSTVLAILLGSMAAYSLTRFKIKKRDQIALWMFSLRMFPPVITAIPLFFFFKKLALLDTHIALILSYCTFNIPFAVWILRGFFLGIPQEYEEAARIDGCTILKALFRIVIPQAFPGIVVTAVFCFVFSWNEFIFALILTRRNAQTVTVQISQFVEGKGVLWGELSSLSLIIALPVLLVIIFAHRHVLKGFAVGELS